MILSLSIEQGVKLSLSIEEGVTLSLSTEKGVTFSEYRARSDIVTDY